jgi:predicted secreted hydrolase
MTPAAFWKSKATGAQYPIGWKISLPSQQAEFAIKAALDDQELRLRPLTYWEGAIDATGTRDGKPIEGRGYLELTGYAAKLNEAWRPTR